MIITTSRNVHVSINCRRQEETVFLIYGLLGINCTRTKLAALYSATKSLQNSCTAKLQLFSSVLEAKQQLNSSCSGMQKRCAAFEALGSGFAAQLPTFKSCEIAAVTLQFSCSQPFCSSFVALLEVILQCCSSAARFVRARMQPPSFGLPLRMNGMH